MRIAIPLSGGQLSQHFGHSEQFLFVDADMEQRQVLHKRVETAPDHAPGLIPAWLAEHRVDIVIAAGWARVRAICWQPTRWRCWPVHRAQIRRCWSAIL